jgi:hypothetical protein
MRRNIIFGDMAEALYRLKKKYGIHYYCSEQEIFEEAKNVKQNSKE